MSRGNARRDIFCSDEDRHLFIVLLGDLSERFDIQVHAYVLMGNHYHLLLKTRQANLSKAMQWFGTTYTRKFNLKNSLDGHLFRGRFKSIIVENDAYLLRLSCYIHRNPLRADIVSRLADYPWSSYPQYAYKKKGPPWLVTQAVLGQLHGNDRHRAYREKVQQYANEQSSIWEDVKHGLIYGSRNFVDDIISRFLLNQKSEELPQHNDLFRAVDPQQLLQNAAEIVGFDLQSARSGKRLRKGEKEKRDLLIYLLCKTGRLSNQTIGGMLAITYSAVSKSISGLNDRMRVDKKLKDEYKVVDSQLSVFLRWGW